MKESIRKIIIRERKGKNNDGNNFNCAGDYMEGNGRALCSSGTDLVLHLDYGEDWTEKVKNKEAQPDAKKKPGSEKECLPYRKK